MNNQLSTRERLLEAAIAQIEEGGEASIKVDAIAAAAEITKPSLYHFFGDRDGLIVAAQAERFKRALVTGQQELVSYISNATTKEEFVHLLASWVNWLSSRDGAKRRAMRADVVGSAVSRPSLAKAVVQSQQEAATSVIEFIEIGRERGWVTLPVDSRSAALWAMALISSRYWIEMDPESDQDDWDKLTFEAIRHLLFDSY